MTTQPFYKKHQRLIIFAGILLLCVLLGIIFESQIMNTLQSIPFVQELYSYVMMHLNEQSYLWLFIAALATSLFLSIIPGDILLVYFIVAGANIWYSSICFFLGLTVGRIINYWIGYLFSGIVTRKILRENNEKFNNRFSTWGTSLLVGGNIFPFFPADIFALFLGTIKYNFWKFLVYNTIGKIIRIAIIIVFIIYLKEYTFFFMDLHFFEWAKIGMRWLLGF